MVPETSLLLLVVALVVVITAVATYWLYIAFAAIRAQLTHTQEEQRSLREELERVEVQLAFSQERIRILERAFREATGQEPPGAATTPPPRRGARAATATTWGRRIAPLFSLDEINSLAFDLGLSSAVKGDTAESRARSLADAAERRGKLDELIELCRQERPEGGF
jgi:hypothetical protein